MTEQHYDPEQYGPGPWEHYLLDAWQAIDEDRTTDALSAAVQAIELLAQQGKRDREELARVRERGRSQPPTNPDTDPFTIDRYRIEYQEAGHFFSGIVGLYQNHHWNAYCSHHGNDAFDTWHATPEEAKAAMLEWIHSIVTTEGDTKLIPVVES